MLTAWRRIQQTATSPGCLAKMLRSSFAKSLRHSWQSASAQRIARDLSVQLCPRFVLTEPAQLNSCPHNSTLARTTQLLIDHRFAGAGGGNMAYSRSLADRVRQTFLTYPGIAEKRLFGGMGFLTRGNLVVAVWGHDLIVRLGAEQASMALQQEFVREFDAPGRPMRGWVVVEAEALDSDQCLAEWIKLAWLFVETLPTKNSPRNSTKRKRGDS